MKRRVALTAATVFSALVIAAGVNADNGNGNGNGNGHGNSHGNSGINGQYAFTGESQCLWVPDATGFNASDQPAAAGSGFSTSNSFLGTLSIGGNLDATIVIVNGGSGLSGPATYAATLTGNADATVSKNKNLTSLTLTLSNLSGKFTAGPLGTDTFTISDITLTGSGSQDHKTLTLGSSAASIQTVKLTTASGLEVFDRICQHSIVAVRTSGAPQSED
jgi:hypothetical protein